MNTNKESLREILELFCGNPVDCDAETEIKLSDILSHTISKQELLEWAENYHFVEEWTVADSEEEKGFQKGLTAGEKLFQKNLLTHFKSLNQN